MIWRNQTLQEASPQISNKAMERDTSQKSPSVNFSTASDSNDPARFVSFGCMSDGSDSPRSSPRVGLSMNLVRTDQTSNSGSASLRRRGSVIAADSFSGGYKKSAARVEVNSDTMLGKVKRAVVYLVLHHYVANFMGVVVIFDSWFTGFDIDARAANQDTPELILLFSEICLIFYTTDIALMLWVHGFKLLKDWMVILDVVIILCGYTETIFHRFQIASDIADSMGILRVLRMARIIRLMKLLRKTRSLKELQKWLGD